MSAVVLLVTGAGCSFLVAGDVPEFQCVDSASACPSGLLCDSATKRCVAALDGTVPEGGDPDVLADDARDGASDVDASGPQDLGSKCRVDGECKSKLCGSSTILTTVITATTGPICTTPCCTSTECDPSFICFNGGTGGSYCVPATLAQRTVPTTGGKVAGATCSANNECRSGLCAGSPKSCLDTCCAASDCSNATTCRLKSVASPAPSHVIWACATAEPGGTKVPGDTCNGDADCTTDTCVATLCRPPCSNTASCRTVPGFTGGHCLYGSDIASNDQFRFCYVPTTGTDLAAGQPCTANGDCQSDYCDAEIKKCANVCGRDSDCAPNEACRPSAVTTPYLRCVKKP